MEHEGCARQHEKRWGRFEDLELYGIIREQWIRNTEQASAVGLVTAPALPPLLPAAGPGVIHQISGANLTFSSINSDRAPSALGGYSQATLVENANRTLFISGQIPETLEGDTPVEFESQCRLVWKNIESQLHAANMGILNLIKVTIFLSSREFAEKNSSIRREILGDHRPALTVIITGIFDEKWLVEIEAYACA
ncbi:MAG: hypothetical protein HKM93_08355 [Desulfobacteraceae bacterium]|nr:hypothetical protein [Desulfobacteraceae bacterium]